VSSPSRPETPAERSQATNVATKWEVEAVRRRAFSKVDPVADTLEFCARDLRLSLDHAALEEVTTAEYARMHKRSPQAVRMWCRRGLILCRKDGSEYYIQRGTAAPRFTRSAS